MSLLRTLRKLEDHLGLKTFHLTTKHVIPNNDQNLIAYLLAVFAQLALCRIVDLGQYSKSSSILCTPSYLQRRIASKTQVSATLQQKEILPQLDFLLPRHPLFLHP